MELYPVAVVGQIWAKGRAKVQQGEIILDEEDAKKYEVVSSPEDSERMAFELASLPWHRKDEREVKRFAQRYGLLWHGWDDVGSGECRESLEDWWREVTRLHFVGAFYQAILDSKHRESATKVQNFLRQFGYGFPSLLQSSQDFDQNYIGAASMLLQSLVNEGLNAGPNNGSQALNGKRRCWWGLETVSPGEFRLTQYPPDLLSLAYSAFSVLIATNVETRFCPVCGKQFRPKPRQGECCSPAHQSTYRGWRRKGKL